MLDNVVNNFETKQDLTYTKNLPTVQWLINQ